MLLKKNMMRKLENSKLSTSKPSTDSKLNVVQLILDPSMRRTLLLRAMIN